MQLLGEKKAKGVTDAVATNARSRLVAAIKRIALSLVGYIKSEKLTDQVLRVRTGRLRRSITAQFDGEDSNFRGIVGTNVKYARAHEEGFQGEVTVKEHTVKAFSRMQTMAFGQPMKEPRIVDVRAHVVKAHAMKMNIPKRPFLAPSVEENMPMIQKEMRGAMAEALK
jgi:phage gpG-like protein